MYIPWIIFGLMLLLGIVLAVFAYRAPEGGRWLLGSVATVIIIFAILSLGILAVISIWPPSNWNASDIHMPVMFQTEEPATSAPDQTGSEAENEVLEGQPAEYYFVPTSDLPECFPVNGPWLEAFAKGLVYEIDPASAIFDQTAFNYAEVVVVPSNPSDLHSVFQLKEKFVAEQGNIWTCGVVFDSKIKHTILFQSADKKWQNWDGQPTKPFHDIRVITPFAGWIYDAGIQPAWALEADDTNLVCPFTTVSMSNPAGVIQSDGSFVGAPGKAGCDFVAIYPDGTAVRYHDAIDSFPYPAGTRFFLFEKKLTNAEVAQALNVASVTDAK